MENGTLKGGVSNFSFVWYIEPGACEKCRALDGKVFSGAGDVPDRPHPNCKCHVEIVGRKDGAAYTPWDEDGQKDEEERRREEFDNLVDELVGDIKSLMDEVWQFENDLTLRYANRSLNEAGVVTLAGTYLSDADVLHRKLGQLVGSVNALCGSDARYVNIVLEGYRQSYQQYRDYYENLLKYFDREITRLKNKDKFKTGFQTDFELHSELKDLNQYIYKPENTELLHGYTPFKKVNNFITGLDAQVFVKDKNIVIVFQGSKQIIQDYVVNDYLNFQKMHQNLQYGEALKLYKTLKNNPRYKDYKITLTGYSLGGNTASMLGAIYNLDTVVFNPYYGIQSQIQKMADDTGETIKIHPEKVVIYRSQNDNLTRENERGHAGDAIYELRNQVIRKKISSENHLLENTVNPSKSEAKGVDINGKIEKTIFYPKLSIKQHNY